MKKFFYIIPGWSESSKYKIYQSLAQSAEKKGYNAVFYDINWKSSLSLQIFPVQKNSVIFGFSLGAIFARLIAQKHECKKLILASMTPLYSFKDKKIKAALVELLDKKFIEDISKNLKTKHQAHSQIVIYGDREEEKGDIIVPRTGHRLNARYVREIVNLL